MILVKFILVFMLFYLLFLTATIEERMQPRSGTYYYLDMEPAGDASIQPKYRLDKVEALKHPHILEVECYPNGAPYRVSKLNMGRRQSSRYFFIDGYNRLRYIGYDNGWGYIRMLRVSDPVN